ncbi:hypothetical protein [Arachidicoccus sp.]|uniref:hypothetical protein n=1 Tax=Arachidicoccus sp. TaxID=1872624 RepID=UPI003D1D7A2A
MKKIVLSLLMVSIVAASFAQRHNRRDKNKDEDSKTEKVKSEKFDKAKLELILAQKKYEDAKTMIDGVLADPKNQDNKEALTYKATIYADIYNDSTLRSKYPDAIQVASNTLNQLQSTTSDTAAFNKLMRQDLGINAISAVYSNAFNEGKDAFGKSQWDTAYHEFKTAAHWANFITQNGFSQNPDRNAIDTFTVLYVGFAAQNASGYIDSSASFAKPAMADSAMEIYTMLADRNIAIPDMAAMYQFMIEYYQAKKDHANATKYIALAKKYYPTQLPLWSQLETKQMLAGGDFDQVMQNYKTKDAAGTLTEVQYIELGETLAKAQREIKDSAKAKEANALAIDAYQKAFAKNPNGIYAFNSGVLYYAEYSKLDDEFYKNRGEGAALKAKRAVIEKAEMPLADSSIIWLTKAYEILSAKTNREKSETISLNRAVDIIANLYSWKMDKARGQDTAAYDKAETGFKKFDALHNSFQ